MAPGWVPAQQDRTYPAGPHGLAHTARGITQSEAQRGVLWVHGRGGALLLRAGVGGRRPCCCVRGWCQIASQAVAAPSLPSFGTSTSASPPIVHARGAERPHAPVADQDVCVFVAKQRCGCCPEHCGGRHAAVLQPPPPAPRTHTLLPLQVCKEGQTLDSNQAAILKVFGVKMADFTLTLLGCWDAEGEEYEQLAAHEGGEGSGSEGEDEDEELLELTGDGFSLPDDSHMMLPAGA